jgi:glycosyltransferase involved in cell wall biosynthesis
MPFPNDTDAFTSDRKPHNAKQPLRIAVFTFSYAPFMTGIATGCHTRVKALLELGHEVALYHPLADDQYSDEIRYRSMDGLNELNENPRFTSASYPTKPHPLDRTHPEPRSHRHWSDSALLEKFGPDVIVVDEASGMRGTSSLYWGGYGKAIGAEYASKHGIPVVGLFETDFVAYSEKHFGGLITRMFRPFIVPVMRKLHQHYVTTLFPSRVMMEKYATFGATPSTHIGFHGVDCAVFHPDAKKHDPLKGDDRPTLLFVGRLVKEKTVDELLVVADIVREKVPDVHLIIAGGGPDAARLKRLAIMHPDTVTMWGETFGDELRGLYARSTIFLNPSSTENFCTTNLEAMACGVPVIAAAAGGNQEQVFDGENGFLSRPHDPEDMAKRVLQVLANRDLRSDLATGSRRWVMDYDIRECVDRLVSSLRGFQERTLTQALPSGERVTENVEQGV